MNNAADLNGVSPDIIIQIITAIITFLAVVVAVWTAQKSHKEYIDSIKPLLSISLIEIHHSLYVRIKNTGRSQATGVSIKVLGISNNGQCNILDLGDLFKSTFDLFPEESVQDKVADYGASICDTAFPSISAEVSYKDHKNKIVSYTRAITFSNEHSESDVGKAIESLKSDVEQIGRSTVRLANYFDGQTQYYFDKLNILPKNTFLENIQECVKMGIDSNQETCNGICFFRRKRK